jgi:hypothetical protein
MDIFFDEDPFIEDSFILEEFEIKLDPREYYYRPGDKIKGELHIKLTEELLLKNVNIVFVGVIQVFYDGYKYESD